MRGNQVSHAKNRTKKVYMPNLHTATVLIDGVKKKMKLCTKCIRRYRVAHTRLDSPVSPSLGGAKQAGKKQDKKKD
jgi:large subunit ribosomal protein L28